MPRPCRSVTVPCSVTVTEPGAGAEPGPNSVCVAASQLITERDRNQGHIAGHVLHRYVSNNEYSLEMTNTSSRATQFGEKYLIANFLIKQFEMQFKEKTAVLVCRAVTTSTIDIILLLLIENNKQDKKY